MRKYGIRQLSAVALTFLALGSIAVGQTVRGEWTEHDLDQVVDAAIAAASANTTKTTEISQLTQLAEALSKVGEEARSKNVLIKAASILDPPSDVTNTSVRGKIIEDTSRAGDTLTAEALITADTSAATQAELWEKFGVGRAQAGDIVGARRAAARIASLPIAPNTTSAIPASVLAIGAIGDALIASGAPEDALVLGVSLQNAPNKRAIIGRAAFALCNSKKGPADTGDGRSKLADQVLETWHQGATSSEQAHHSILLIGTTAEAILACRGAAAAQAFIAEATSADEQDAVYAFVVNNLVGIQAVDLARAITRSSATDDPHGLVQEARYLITEGNPAAAKEAALKAYTAITVHADRTMAANGNDRHALLQGLFGVLIDVGAYDEAIAAVQPVDVAGRKQDYTTLIRTQIRARDAVALKKYVPLAIETFGLPTPVGVRPVPDLINLTRILALAGYREEAEEAYKELMKLSADQTQSPLNRVQGWQLAELKADMGDLSGAITMLTDPALAVSQPNGLQVLALTAMMFDGARTPPTNSEIHDAMEKAQASLPSMKDQALSSIVVDMASMGDVKGALQAEGVLDGDAGGAVSLVRDTALSSIADAQIKAGYPRDAFVTQQRISQTYVRWNLLLKLAAIAPTN